MAQHSVSRYGKDSPARIGSSTTMLAESNAMLPGEPVYQPIIPFLPTITTGTGAVIGGTAEEEIQSWQRYPERCDLTFYQGDDVVITLYIQDPNSPDLDMTDPAEWEWSAQIRVIHSYHSTLVNTFSVVDEYTPAVVDPPTPAYTQVTLFLPRTENVYVGRYRWDLYSLSPFDAALFPRPPDVPEPEPWPPTDRLRTWLYGQVTVLPRVTSTDALPVPVDEGGGPVQVVYSGAFAGPNGRVP